MYAPYFQKTAPTPHPLPEFADNKHRLPAPVLPAHPEWLDLYWACWEMAFAHLRQPEAGSPLVSNWLDEAFSNTIFQWDTIFMMLFARYMHHVFPAIQSLDNFYRLQRPSGFICREYREADGKEIHYDADGKLFSPNGWRNTVNPPLFSWAEMLTFRFTGDKSRLAMVLPVLEKYAAWLDREGDPEDRDSEANGRRAHAKHQLYWNTPLGSGMDNTPRPVFPGSGWVDMSSQMVIMYNSLANLCTELGKHTKAKIYRQKANDIGGRINTWCWDEDDGLYYDVRRDGTRVKKKTIASFWPLLAEVAPHARAQRLLDHVKNPGEFWRPMVFPSLAACEPEYRPDGGYWLGGVWAPTNVMVIKGLQKYGFEQTAAAATANYLTGMAQVFQDTATVWENYAPENFRPGVPAKPDFVGWSGCGPIALLIENILGLRVDGVNGKLTWVLRRSDRHGIERLSVGPAQVSAVAEAVHPGQDSRKIDVTCDRPFTLQVNQPTGPKTFFLRAGKHRLQL